MYDSLKEVWECLLFHKANESKEPLELNISAKCADEMYDALSKRFQKRESHAKKKCPNCNKKPHIWYCSGGTNLARCPECEVSTDRYKSEIEAIRAWNNMVDEMIRSKNN